MPKQKKVQNEEGGETEAYESFDENLEVALNEEVLLDGIPGGEDDFNPEAALGLDVGIGSDAI